MKELIENLGRTLTTSYLLDTCFIINVCIQHEKQLEQFCKDNDVAISSFTAEELDYVKKHLTGTENHAIRKFLKSKLIKVIACPISPGDREGERNYVSAYDPKILHIVPDPSDAVLVVHALLLGATVLTKDKHHVFTTVAENYVQKHNISILKEFPR
jgi:predicted nucleic acid-binding protein